MRTLFLLKDDVPGMLTYSLTVCMSLLQSRQFRNKVSSRHSVWHFQFVHWFIFFQSRDTCTLCCVSRSERQLPEWQHKQTVCTVSWWLPQHLKYHILILCKNNTKPSFYWRFVLYLWLPVTFSPAIAMSLSFAKSFLLVKLFLLLKTITVRIQNL